MEKNNKHGSNSEEPNFAGKLDGSDSWRARLKESVFFSKYFPSVHPEHTHLQLLKVITGMNPLDEDQLYDHDDSSGTANSVNNPHVLSASHTTSVPQPARSQFCPNPVSSRHQTCSQNLPAGVPDKEQYLLNWVHMHHERNAGQDFTPVGFVGVNTKISNSMAGESGGSVSSNVLQDTLQDSTSWEPELSASASFLYPKMRSSASSSVDKIGCEALHHADRHQQEELMADEMPHSTGVHQMASSVDSGLCQVCEDVAAGFYCGAFVCEACKVSVLKCIL